MSYKKIYLCLLFFLLNSCKANPETTIAPEYLHEAKSQKLINFVINNQKSSISLLYGNDTALLAAGDSGKHLLPGAYYTLVTWKQKAMPHWYGSNMNGAIFSIEHVKILPGNNKRIDVEYQFEKGAGFRPGDIKPDQDNQLAMIISLPAAVFP